MVTDWMYSCSILCVVALLLIIADVVICAGNSMEFPTNTWNILNYPNPQTNPEACGRSKKSWVCDPDGLISPPEADSLDTQIASLMSTTSCPCAPVLCQQKAQNQGYSIAIALAKRITSDDVLNNAELSYLETTQLSETFTSDLLQQRWKFGSCKEDVIVTFSLHDNFLYTVANEVAGRTLTRPLIGQISNNLRVYFSGSGNISVGLQMLIDDYRMVFNGNYDLLYDYADTPRLPLPVLYGNSAASITTLIHFLTFVCISTALACIS